MLCALSFVTQLVANVSANLQGNLEFECKRKFAENAGSCIVKWGYNANLLI